MSSSYNNNKKKTNQKQYKYRLGPNALKYVVPEAIRLAQEGLYSLIISTPNQVSKIIVQMTKAKFKKWKIFNNGNEVLQFTSKKKRKKVYLATLAIILSCGVNKMDKQSNDNDAMGATEDEDATELKQMDQQMDQMTLNIEMEPEIDSRSCEFNAIFIVNNNAEPCGCAFWNQIMKINVCNGAKVFILDAMAVNIHDVDAMTVKYFPPTQCEVIAPNGSNTVEIYTNRYPPASKTSSGYYQMVCAQIRLIAALKMFENDLDEFLADELVTILRLYVSSYPLTCVVRIKQLGLEDKLKVIWNDTTTDYAKIPTLIEILESHPRCDVLVISEFDAVLKMIEKDLGALDGVRDEWYMDHLLFADGQSRVRDLCKSFKFVPYVSRSKGKILMANSFCVQYPRFFRRCRFDFIIVWDPIRGSVRKRLKAVAAFCMPKVHVDHIISIIYMVQNETIEQTLYDGMDEIDAKGLLGVHVMTQTKQRMVEKRPVQIIEEIDAKGLLGVHVMTQTKQRMVEKRPVQIIEEIKQNGELQAKIKKFVGNETQFIKANKEINASNKASSWVLYLAQKFIQKNNICPSSCETIKKLLNTCISRTKL
eukprot:787356_1